MARAPFDPSTDYYGMLGVAPAATAAEITVAYRRLAKRYHPDVNAGSAVAVARMARLNRAKAVLLDAPTRSAYDRARDLRHGVPLFRAAPTAATVGRVATAVRPSTTARTPRAAASVAGYNRAGRRHRWLDRQTAVLLALLVPLLGGTVLYVVDALQVAARPVRPTAAVSDLALSPQSRPTAVGIARTAFMIVAAHGPNRRAAAAANNVIRSVVDYSPEGTVLRATGEQLLRAADEGDERAWREAVARLCALAEHC